MRFPLPHFFVRERSVALGSALQFIEKPAHQLSQWHQRFYDSAVGVGEIISTLDLRFVFIKEWHQSTNIFTWHNYFSLNRRLYYRFDHTVFREKSWRKYFFNATVI